MELSTFLKIIIAIIGASIISFITLYVAKKFSKGWSPDGGVWLFSGILIYFSFNIFSVKIIEVYDNNGKLDYKEREYLGSYDYELPDGKKINLKRGDKYIINKADEMLVYYSEHYARSYTTHYNTDLKLIPECSVVNIENIPDCYFHPAPSKVQSKSSSKTIWVLESYKDFSNRRENDLNDLNEKINKYKHE